MTEEIRRIIRENEKLLAKEMTGLNHYYANDYLKNSKDKILYFASALEREFLDHPERAEETIRYVRNHCPTMEKLDELLDIDDPSGMMRVFHLIKDTFYEKKNELSSEQIAAYKARVLPFEQKYDTKISEKDLENIALAIEKWGMEPVYAGWNEKYPSKDILNGYTKAYDFDFAIDGICIQRIDCMFVFEDDKAAAEQAIKDGVGVLADAAQWIKDHSISETCMYLLDTQENREAFAKLVLRYETAKAAEEQNRRRMVSKCYIHLPEDVITEIINYVYRDEDLTYKFTKDEKGTMVQSSSGDYADVSSFMHEMCDSMLDNPRFDMLEDDSKELLYYALDKYDVDAEKIEYLMDQSLYSIDEAVSHMERAGFQFDFDQSQRIHGFCFTPGNNEDIAADFNDLLMFDSKHEMNRFIKETLLSKEKEVQKETPSKPYVLKGER